MYSQRDPLWSNEILGFGSNDPTDTIGNYGCFLTSMARLSTWAGHTINPSELNELFKSNNFFTQDLINNHQAPCILFPEVLEWVEEVHWVSETPMDYFSDASDPTIGYIIQIDASPAPGLQSHFVFVWATLGNDLQIDDPWDGKRKNLSLYGDPKLIIQSAYKYRKVNMDAQQQIDQLKQQLADTVKTAEDRLNSINILQTELTGTQAQVKVLRDELAKAPTQEQVDTLEQQLAQANAQLNKPSVATKAAQFNKTWIALAGLVLSIIVMYFGADNQYVQLLIGAATLVGVHVTPNKSLDTTSQQ